MKRAEGCNKELKRFDNLMTSLSKQKLANKI